MKKIIINGKNHAVDGEKTLLQLCREIGIEIPTLCEHKYLSPSSSCRLCLVEVEGMKNPTTSCSLMAEEGMVVETHSARVVKLRRDILDLLFSNHRDDCLTCQKSGTCKLQDYCFEYGVERGTYEGEMRSRQIDNSNPFYYYNPQKCILCGKCTEVCSKLQGSSAIDMVDRGFRVHVGVLFGVGVDNSTCVSCGNCVSVCPVGALMPKEKEKYRRWELEKTKTTCSYCGVGCQMNLLTKGGKVVGVDPLDGPSNQGLLCVKGKFGYKFINHSDRLTKPLIKENGEFREASWDQAISYIVSKISDIGGKYGNDALGGFASARCTNEENYLFQKLFRAVLKTNNVDHCARLCHASTVAGLAMTLGSGAMTNSVAETRHNDLIFVTGSNTTENHPVIGASMKQAIKNGAKLIVIDPRKIELADYADVYLQIRLGTNIAVINGIMNVIVERELYDVEYIESRTEDFEVLKKSLESYTPELVAEICGVDAEDIVKAAELYAKANRAGIYYAMGITQHTTGTHSVMAISNLAQLCGNIGKEYAGVNPLRGQNNVQGACDMGGLPSDYPGYQKVFKEPIVEKFKKSWGVDSLSTEVGLTISEMLDSVKFLYIMGENPMVSDPDINQVKKALEEKELLVVQDIFLTETAELADVVLPGASFAEKDGTFTNTERRVQRIRKAIEPVGESKPDWQIIVEIMNKLGYEKVYKSSSEIMEEISSVTPSYRGITYERIEDEGIQWPCPTESHPGTKYLHKDMAARGRGLFLPVHHSSSAELPDKDYPYVMTTGRVLYHYHTRSMTGRVDGLNRKVPESYMEISEELANRLDISDGELVKVSSRRGEIEVKAKISDMVEGELVFIPFHFAEGGANYLTGTELDPIAKIPELKVSAVNIEKKAK